MVEKTEASFRQLLRDMSDTQIKRYYRDLEWTAFPVLLIKEYQKRFNATNSKKMTDRLKMQTNVALQQSDMLKKMVAQKGGQVKADLIKQATGAVSQGVASAKKITQSTRQDLEILEKLAALNKKGVITDREFQEKKKDILKKI